MSEAWNLDASKTVKDALTEKVAVIGENLSIRSFVKIVAAHGCVLSYIHGAGRICVVVDAETTTVTDEVKEALSILAIQIVSLVPVYFSTDSVSEEYQAQ